MPEKKTRYTDSIANAFSEVRAWRTSALLLGALVIALVGLNIYQSANKPMVLVPYEFAANKTPVTVETTGEIAGTSEEYITNLALADLALVMNFTPDTVRTAHLRFLNRLTPDLSATQKSELSSQAERYRAESRSQSFYPSDTKLVAKNKVEVTGTVVQWTGDKEVLRAKTTYVVTYVIKQGYFHVADLRQK
jgi:hypothetical protein